MYNFFINDNSFFKNNFSNLIKYLNEISNLKIITPDGDFFINNEHLDTINVPFQRKKIKLIDLVRTLFYYFKCINRKQINTFITIIPIFLGGVGCFLKKTNGIFYFTGLGTIFISESFSGKILRFLIKKYLKIFLDKKSNIVVVQNNSDFRYFTDIMNFKNCNVYLIRGCGVNINKYKFDKKIKLNKKLRIFIPARLIKEKGIKDCIEASIILIKSNIDHEFIFSSKVDHGNPSSFTQEEIDDFSKYPSINFIGYVDDIRDVYLDCDVVCLPSYREGLPNSLLEASSIGRLIIASDVPGCNDVIDDLENGLLFKPKNPEGLADVIRRIAENKVDYNLLIKNAYEKVVNLYSDEAILNDLLSNVYSIKNDNSTNLIK